LGQHLAPFQIEKQMESLTQGYLRALGEKDEGRQQQVWALLQSTEQSLSGQFARFAAGFARVPAQDARASKLPIYLPLADRLAAASFDVREVLAIHAQGIARAARNEAGAPARAAAFTMSAELFLMQHTCHWFCKSKTVASARLLARHQTAYRQVLEAVTPETRAAYSALVGP